MHLLPATTPTGPPMIGAWPLDTVQCCDALDLLRGLPAGSVDCCITSPPYFGLRDYGVDGQIGLEDTPQAYVARLAELFREVRRVLKDTGTCWINLGDSYVGATSQHRDGGSQSHNSVISKKTMNGIPDNGRAERNRALYQSGLAMKQLIGIPWRIAFALQDDGWILRSDIIWHKPNPMPESVTDRPTKAHEYVFLLAKEPRYYYDAAAIKEPSIDAGKTVKLGSKSLSKGQAAGARVNPSGNGIADSVIVKEFRNKRSVWTIPTKPNPEAHFATYPDELITPMILAGCAPCGVVLDPFMGSGTTALVARKQGRHFIGSELNPDYVAIANRRLSQPYTLNFMTHLDAPVLEAVQ
jgi:DNA modification methylase